jgi:peptidyl-prolyl cis-trans isomerase B (cyclophilin B)
MTGWTRCLAVATVLFVASACARQEKDASPSDQANQSGPQPKPVVVFETSKGTIAMELEPDLAPETVQNFLLHVRNKFYDSLTFHRVRPGFMIQAGRIQADGRERTSTVFPIANEAENGLTNVRGAVAMARTSDPHSATSEFFINVVDNPSLNFKDKTARGFGYAVFGHVVEGMPVVDAIAQVPTRRTRNSEAEPIEPVVISRAYIRDSPPGS